MRIAIVGAGIVGACIAHRLATEGLHDVTLVEAGQRPGGGASGRSFGWINHVT